MARTEVAAVEVQAKAPAPWRASSSSPSSVREGPRVEEGGECLNPQPGVRPCLKDPSASSQTPRRKEPREPPPQPRVLPGLAVALASSYPGGSGPRSRVRAALRDPEPPSPGPGRRAATPPPRPATAARGPSVNKLRAQSSEKRAGAGRLPARTPESREERERARRLKSSGPPAPGRSRPAHTGTRLHTRAHTQARTPPQPRAGVPGPPRPPRPPDGSGGRHSGAARRGGNFAPGRPRLAAPAGGRQKLRRRRRPRGQAPARLASRGPRARGLGSRHQRTPAGCRAAPPPPPGSA
ncbi:basic salivary proline-rich protein 3-like [Eumetopias jubatus]|uniref:basic salivary proline-rich protein 3-like n=1 Tax=Eumetopias jubatus TaxID=34886 RepID=UPI001016A229|nr:basic salivary proline-rich protein 3-like [Eumetopias jubatus]